MPIEWAIIGTVIVSILTTIWTGAKWVGDQLREVFKVVINFLMAIYKQTIDLMPRQAKILLFLLFVMVLANPITSWFFSLNYFCTTEGELYHAHSIPAGIRLNIEALFKGVNSTEVEYSEWITENTIKSQNYEDGDYKGIVSIKCAGDGNPKLHAFGIEFFNYQNWIILIMIGLFIKLMFILKR